MNATLCICGTVYCFTLWKDAKTAFRFEMLSIGIYVKVYMSFLIKLEQTNAITSCFFRNSPLSLKSFYELKFQFSFFFFSRFSVALHRLDKSGNSVVRYIQKMCDHYVDFFLSFLLHSKFTWSKTHILQNWNYLFEINVLVIFPEMLVILGKSNNEIPRFKKNILFFWEI